MDFFSSNLLSHNFYSKCCGKLSVIGHGIFHLENAQLDPLSNCRLGCWNKKGLVFWREFHAIWGKSSHNHGLDHSYFKKNETDALIR